MSDSTAITKTLPLDIQTGDDAWRHAQRLAQSSIVPETLRGKPHDLMLVITWGRKLDMSPEQAIQDIHVIKGKPVVAADALVAQCLKRRDVCRYFLPTVSSSDRAEYQTHREGSPVPTTMSYTIEDAKRAGLTGKENWKNHPAAMLRARCASAMARAVYPDLVRNYYIADELEDIPGTTTLVQAPRTLAELTAPLAQNSGPVVPRATEPPVLEAIEADEAAEIAAQERGE